MQARSAESGCAVPRYAFPRRAGRLKQFDYETVIFIKKVKRKSIREKPEKRRNMRTKMVCANFWRAFWRIHTCSVSLSSCISPRAVSLARNNSLISFLDLALLLSSAILVLQFKRHEVL